MTLLCTIFVSLLLLYVSQGTRAQNLCTYCPPSTKTCEDNGAVTLKRGYWKAVDEASYIHKCPARYSCGGGNVTGDISCRVGYVGPLCDVCAKDYFHAIDGSCAHCSHRYFISTCVAGCLVVLAIYGFVPLLWVVRVALKRTCSDEFIQGLSPTNALVQMFRYMYILKGLSGAAVDDAEASTRTEVKAFRRRLHPTCKIFISLFQMATLLPLVLDLRYADEGVYSKHLSRLSRFTYLNGNVAWSCFGSFDYLSVLVITAAVPVVATVLLLNAHRAHHIYITTYFPALRRMPVVLQKLQSEYLWVFLQGLFLVSPCVLTTAFRSFSCIDIDPLEELHSGTGSSTSSWAVLRADKSILCGSTRFRTLRYVGIATAVVYGIGVPVLYWCVLRHRPTLKRSLSGVENMYRPASSSSLTPIRKTRSSLAVTAMQGGGQLSGVRSLCGAYKDDYW